MIKKIIIVLFVIVVTTVTYFYLDSNPSIPDNGNSTVGPIPGNKASIYEQRNRGEVNRIRKMLDDSPLAVKVSLGHKLLKKSFGELIDITIENNTCPKGSTQRKVSEYIICRKSFRMGKDDGLAYHVDQTYQNNKIRSRVSKIGEVNQGSKILFNQNSDIKVMELTLDGKEVYRFEFPKAMPSQELSATDLPLSLFRRLDEIYVGKATPENADFNQLLQIETHFIIKTIEFYCLDEIYFPACLLRDAWNVRNRIYLRK